MIADLKSAISRANAVIEGIKLCGYGFQAPLPVPGELSYVNFEGARHIDDWAGWHRLVSQKLEVIQSSESVSVFSTPLGQQSNFYPLERLPAPAVEFEPLYAAPLVNNLPAKISQGETLAFAIQRLVPSPDNPPLQAGSILPYCFSRYARLRSVGFTVSMRGEEYKNWRFNIGVKPPGCASFVVIGNVGALPEGPAWSSDQSFYNRRLDGRWEVIFMPYPVNTYNSQDNHRATYAYWPILDIQLHLQTIG